ncbi:hypothetical protein [Pelomonas sp. Root1237]|uniref:hypothetical protein n=1 Tax=Pelomonas sp. Root1237 TaxID=1736434 RepID=UPI0012FC1E95|nr:hypothetical protein [Pelomonas sp. Root1237]
MLAAEPAPIACTLGPSEMGPRLVRIRQLTQAFLRSHELRGSTLHLVYDPGVQEELAQVVELERSCCAFLEFRLTSDADAVRLDITGPEQNAASARWLFSQFLPAAEAESPSGSGCGCKR